jgi:site-specific DNA-methyltransferase (adenine-specific)
MRTVSMTTWDSWPPKLERPRELLAPEGTLYVHLDYREAHYVKVALDAIFGRDCFLNEIIWAYDYGGKPTRRWPAKHDTILVYVRDRERHLFDADAVEREPYMAPGLVGPEKAARGKRPTDTWWHTIVATAGASGPATRPRSPRACCDGSSRPRRVPAAGALTSSPARARSARSARRSDATTC